MQNPVTSHPTIGKCLWHPKQQKSHQKLFDLRMHPSCVPLMQYSQKLYHPSGFSLPSAQLWVLLCGFVSCVASLSVGVSYQQDLENFSLFSSSHRLWEKNAIGGVMTLRGFEYSIYANTFIAMSGYEAVSTVTQHGIFRRCIFCLGVKTTIFTNL